MSNLLDKASILLTPTAYDEERMLTIKPVDNLGSQLVPGSNFEDPSLWIIGAGASISDGQANFVGSQSQVFRTGVFIEFNTKYQITYEVVSSNTAQGLHTNRGGTCMPLNLPSSVGVHTVYATSGSSGGRGISIGTRAGVPTANITISYYSIKEVIGGDFSFTRGTSATRVNAEGLIETVGVDIPRISYLGDSCGYWLLEPASTNTATYSNDFSQGTNFNSGNRTLSDAVLSTNQGTAPDGTNTAQKLTDNNNGGTGAISLNSFGVGLTSNTDATVSMFVKKDTVRFFVIKFLNFDSNQETSFDLDTGIVNRGTGVMTDYGNGWYRCSATFLTVTDLIGAIQFLITNSSSSTGGNLRNGSNSTLVWGYQAEYSSFATSYIPTVATIVPRNKDEAFGSGNSNLINSSEGVIYAEYAALANEGTTRSISISDGTQDNRVLFGPHAAPNSFLVNVKTLNVLQVSNSISLVSVTDFNKVAIKYKQDDVSIFRNGSKVTTDTSVNIPAAGTYNTLQLNSGAGFSDFSGKIKCIAVFKDFLTDSEINCLTS